MNNVFSLFLRAHTQNILQEYLARSASFLFLYSRASANSHRRIFIYVALSLHIHTSFLRTRVRRCLYSIHLQPSILYVHLLWGNSKQFEICMRTAAAQLHRAGDALAVKPAVKGKKKRRIVRGLWKNSRDSVSRARANRGRFRCPEKAGRNVALLSRAPPRIRNLVNSPETVNSGTFDSRSLLCHSPSDQSDPNHGCHGPTLLRTNGPTSARTYKRRSARPDKSHAAASRMEPGTSRRTMNAQK